jgi:hypothetical protein
MALELELVPVVEHAEGRLGEPVAGFDARHQGSFPSFARRTLISAVRRRVFTVPRGIPSASAISRAVSPPK